MGGTRFPQEHSVTMPASGGNQFSYLYQGCFFPIASLIDACVFSGSFAVVPTVCDVIARTSEGVPHLLGQAIALADLTDMAAAQWTTH